MTPRMTSPDIDNINHVGMAVRDLNETVRRFEAMGFQLTPYSPHSAAWKPGDAVKPLGSGNRCVMFANDYLEILASEDSSRPAPRITNFLKRHQGAHIICFNTEDPQGVDLRLHKAGVVTSGVIPLQRDIDTPDGAHTAKFERVQFAPNIRRRVTSRPRVTSRRNISIRRVTSPIRMGVRNCRTRSS